MAAADARRVAYRVAFGGLSAALALLALLGVRVMPTADLALYTVASLCVSVTVIETGRAGGALCWLAAGLAGLAVAGGPAALPFLSFFGPYPLIKSRVDPVTRTTLSRHLLNLLTGNVLMGLSVLLALLLFPEMADVAPLPWWALALLAQPVLLVYGWGLELLIRLYLTRLRRR